MIDNKIIIVSIDNRYIFAGLSNDRLANIYAYSDIDKKLKPGIIVNARVNKVLDNIDGCFVRVSKDETGYLDKAYKCETVIPVLHKKEASGNKKALYTDDLSIAGKYCIVYEKGAFVRTSSKLSKTKKAYYKEIFNKLAIDTGLGILIRSCAVEENISDEDITKEILSIKDKLVSIRQKSNTRPEYTILYEKEPQIIEDCNEFIKDKEAVEIVTDCEEIYHFLEDYYIRNELDNATDRVKLRFYSDTLLPLANLYGLNQKISQVTSRIVNLKNGADLVFDKTEALVAIDINSYRCKKNQLGKEEYVLELNKDAFCEIARQIILRNYSGIIIVDFINMKNRENYDILANHIKDILAKYRNFTFHGFTKLGLAEISRQKVRSSFVEQMR